MDLSTEEYHAFAEGIAQLAAERERKPLDFQDFQAFMDANGPYGCLIDGANVALYGYHYNVGGFSWDQIGAVVEKLREEFPDKKPLLVRPIPLC